MLGACGTGEEAAPVPAVAVADPGTGTRILAADAAATAASGALFEHSPVAVVAAGAADIAAAGAEATDLGVPLLVAAPGAQEDVRSELERLGAGTVLTFGAPEAGWNAYVDDAQQVTAAGELPEYTRDPAAADAVVLTDGTPAAAAAEATARAAGADVAVVPDGDPRADGEVVRLLHEHAGAAVFAVGASFGSPELLAGRTAVARTGVELPGGGQTVFPGRRMVALYGHPDGGSLGVLGEQGIDASIRRAQDTAAQYQPYSAEPVVPALEIIATVASAEAGPDGNYSRATAPEQLLPWIEAAEEAGVYVVLDLQPGRGNFLDQARIYEDLLKRPSVGLALDPEWRLAPGQHHLEQVGSVDAAEVNSVADWLAALTRDHALPQKVLMLHQFNLAMISNRTSLNVGHDELALSLHADGHGTPGEKLQTWDTLLSGLQPEIRPGWKNFYDEDKPTLTPEQTFTDISPKPWFISYQ